MPTTLATIKIDPALIPTTLDLYHVILAGTVAVLALILVLILLMIVFSLLRKLRKAEKAVPQPQSAVPAPQPEVKIVEKIVEKLVPQPAPEPVILRESTPDAALQLLSLMQKEARFIDFIQEDITPYSDTDIGVAARVVHEGCRKVIDEHFTLAAVRKEQENSKITLPKGFDAEAVRITGNIVGQPPFTGTLVHKGWQATDVRLPKLTQGHNANVIAAAEVEL
ncbi:MAG: DUF2760 domain-containing protein [Gammaproteobacteria bacterium]